MNYYKISGKTDVSRFPLGLLTGVGLSVIVAFLYIWLGSLLSFIIVKILLLTGAVYTVLQIVKLANRISKNRNQNITRLFILVNSLTLLYCSWVFFVVLVLGRNISDAVPHLFDYVKLLFNFQVYEVTTPMSWFRDTNGAVASGWETYVVLGGEAFLLAFGPLIGSKIDHFDNMVFCENCNQWIKRTARINKEFTKPFSKAQLEKMIIEGDLSELMDLPDSPQNSKLFYEINLYQCQSCSSSNFIRIRKRDFTFSKNDRSEVLIDYCQLTNMKLIDSLISR